MTHRTVPLDRDVRVAPGVTWTRLPSGGAVLIRGTTLELLECAEPEAMLISTLLARRPDPPEWPEQLDRTREAVLRDLTANGWLVTGGQS